MTFKGCGQVYGTASEQVALSTPPPTGYAPEDKRIFFISNEIDDGKLVVYELDQEKVLEEAIQANNEKEEEKKRKAEEKKLKEKEKEK